MGSDACDAPTSRPQERRRTPRGASPTPPRLEARAAGIQGAKAPQGRWGVSTAGGAAARGRALLLVSAQTRYRHSRPRSRGWARCSGSCVGGCEVQARSYQSAGPAPLACVPRPLCGVGGPPAWRWAPVNLRGDWRECNEGRRGGGRRRWPNVGVVVVLVARLLGQQTSSNQSIAYSPTPHSIPTHRLTPIRAPAQSRSTITPRAPNGADQHQPAPRRGAAGRDAGGPAGLRGAHAGVRRGGEWIGERRGDRGVCGGGDHIHTHTLTTPLNQSTRPPGCRACPASWCWRCRSTPSAASRPRACPRGSTSLSPTPPSGGCVGGWQRWDRRSISPPLRLTLSDARRPSIDTRRRIRRQLRPLPHHPRGGGRRRERPHRRR